MRLRGVLLLLVLGIVTKGCDNVGERGKILPTSFHRSAGIPLVLRNHTRLVTLTPTSIPVSTYTPIPTFTSTSTPATVPSATLMPTPTLTLTLTPTPRPTSTAIPSPIPTYTKVAATPATMHWLFLRGNRRITYYAPSFHNGDITASGEPYDCCAMRVALGPELLAQAQAAVGYQWPWVRITDRQTGIRYEFKVNDTGSTLLQVDLPYCTWLFLYGYPREQGVFYGMVEVGKDCLLD